jgi:uncharacterized sulfatase
LDDDGLDENTVVFFWGVHGRGLPRAKRFVYDSGLRVPLIVRWPGKLDGGKVTDDLVSLLDLGPTVLSLAGVQVPSYMQGQAFLGEQKRSPRAYAFAHRDRMDEAYDMMRSVRDKRYRYIRNFFPGRPYAQHIEYMEEMPTMKEMRRLYKDHMNALGESYGKALTPAQLLFFQPSKPEEELYDISLDPHEINNLASSSSHQQVLRRMREALKTWQQETKDLGLVPEAELRERMRPGGAWAIVSTPALHETVIGESVKLTIVCPTEGASIAYSTESGGSSQWKLYTGEVVLKRPAKLRVKACRLGYKDSDEIVKQY